jgi:hypothetical protein
MKSLQCICVFLSVFVFHHLPCHAGELGASSRTASALYEQGMAGNTAAIAELLADAQRGNKTAQDQISTHSLITVLKPLAERGDGEAEYEVGLLYEYGWGVAQDYEESVKWLTRSAKKGNDHAQRFLLKLNRNRQERQSREGAAIIRAVYISGDLWLLSDRGDVSLIREHTDRLKYTPLPEPAIDIWQQRDTLWAITCKRTECVNWTLFQLDRGRWVKRSTIPALLESLVGVGASGAETFLLTSSRLITISTKFQKVVKLSQQIIAGSASSLLVLPAYVLVGRNSGEHGGGLLHIDRQTGKVSQVEGVGLTPSVDPVTALVSEPWTPQCAVAAIGMVHLSSRGRLVEVCGTSTRQLYTKSYTRVSGENDDTSSVAFFGLAVRGGIVWAVANNGVYGVYKTGRVDVQPLPPFSRIGGVDVSFELPGFVIVLTTSNEGHSVSGPVPIILKR